MQKRLLKSVLFIATTATAAASFGQGAMGHSMDKARYGGPVYSGAPALTVTASLIEAGGGMDGWSFIKAVTSIAGEKLATAEVTKLTKQYGKARVGTFVKVSDFVIADALKIATAAGIKLPDGNLTGKALGAALIGAGQDKGGTFYTEFLLDKAVSHAIHMQVMNDIDAKFGEASDKDYHRISNQAHYDLGKALGLKVKLAKLH